MKVRVTFIFPPIPVRDFDYSAINDDTYDGAPDSSTRGEIGHGATAEAAIADLLQFEDYDRRCRTGNRTADDGACQHCHAVEGERCRDPIEIIGGRVMSWEAWGDDDDGRYDHLLDAGWIDGDAARDLRGKMLALSWERMVLMAAYDMSSGAFEKAMLYSEADCVIY